MIRTEKISGRGAVSWPAVGVVIAAALFTACANGADGPRIIEIDYDEGGGATADADAAAQCADEGLNAVLLDDMGDTEGRRRHRRYECR
ncbi:MAG: hypothetical protein AAF224_02060 [Pseudomonadota bacterium]